MNEFFVLTHEYSDRSAVSVCGLTQDANMVQTWLMGSDENKAYKVPLNDVAHWMNGWPKIDTGEKK